LCVCNIIHYYEHIDVCVGFHTEHPGGRSIGWLLYVTVYACEYICIYMPKCLCACVSMFMSVCVYLFVCVCVFVNMCVCVCVCVCVCLHALSCPAHTHSGSAKYFSSTGLQKHLISDI